MAYILKQLAGTDWLKDFNPPGLQDLRGVLRVVNISKEVQEGLCIHRWPLPEMDSIPPGCPKRWLTMGRGEGCSGTPPAGLRPSFFWEKFCSVVTLPGCPQTHSSALGRAKCLWQGEAISAGRVGKHPFPVLSIIFLITDSLAFSPATLIPCCLTRKECLLISLLICPYKEL